MSYQHVQKGYLHWVLYASALVTLALLGLPQIPTVMIIVVIGAALLLVVFGLSFKTMAVADEGDHLSVRYGPIPLFHKRLAYEFISDAHPARSRWIDGWGIHYIFGRGWTYNLWGFDCVEFQYKDRPCRIGTDDVQGLTDWLRSRTGNTA
jgi:hypothetical protein